MEGDIGDFFEMSKDDQRKHINHLLALVRRFSERTESTDDERLRWAKARMATAIVAWVTGNMDRATFGDESAYHASWIAWAVGGVSFTAESPPTCVQDQKDFAPQKVETSQSSGLSPIAERVREIQELNRKRLLEPFTPDTEPKKKLQ